MKNLINLRYQKTKKISICLFSMGLFFLVNPIFGQNTEMLFSNTTRDAIGFTGEQSIKLNNMIANPIYLDHFFLKVNELAEIQEDGNINVNFPDKTGAELFVAKEIQYKTAKDFMYFGELANCDEEKIGYIHLIAKNGNIFGQINIDEEIYELHDFGEHKNVLFKINPSIYTEAECGVTASNKNRKEPNPSLPIRTQNCNVRVLVLFTAAANSVGNPQNSANLFIQQTNQSIGNSAAQAHFVLAGVQELTGFTETLQNVGLIGPYAIDTTLDILQADTTARALRDSFKADLVVLLTDGNWWSLKTPTDSIGQYWGLSYLNYWGDADFGYALVEIDAGGGRYTFTHELAHNFGCKHDTDTEGAPNFVFEARGKKFHAPILKTRRTIMAGLKPNRERILHFSNSSVKFKGTKTGTANERENANQITAETCNIAAYRPFIPLMNVNIGGPVKGNNTGIYTWCVSITECPSPISIVWEYSINGINYYTWASNQNCITGNLPLDKNLWLRVTVVCDDGQIDVGWFYVLNQDVMRLCSIGTSELQGDDNSIIENTVEEFSFALYPNPAENLLTLEFETVANTATHISIVNLSSVVVQEIIQTATATSEAIQKSIDISALESAYYFIKVTIDGQSSTKSFIKI